MKTKILRLATLVTCVAFVLGTFAAPVAADDRGGGDALTPREKALQYVSTRYALATTQLRVVGTFTVTDAENRRHLNRLMAKRFFTEFRMTVWRQTA